MRSLLLALALLLPLPAPAQTLAPGDRPPGDTVALHPEGLARALDALPDIVAAIMARSGVPGMAVAVVHGGETVFAHGFGIRRAGEAAEVTPETVFQIASISKSVSATVAAIAVARGLAHWDDPVATHLPGLRLSDPYVTAHATIGDFFAHRSGLPAAAGDDLEDLGFDRATILARLEQLQLDAFRISYHYANFGTTTAAEAVAAAAGRPWEDLADELLFAPAGMTATSYRHADFLAHENRAALHAREDGTFRALFDRDPDAQAPAGGVSSNLRDLARWLHLLLGDGTLEGDEIYAPEAMLPALRPQVTSAPGHDAAERSGAYGYGFNVGVTATGAPEISHSGAFLLGAGTHFRILPGAGIGIVILSNAAPVGAVEAIGAEFMEVVQFGHASRDWFAAYHAAIASLFDPVGDLPGQERPARAEAPGDLAAFAGRYDSAYFGAAEIAREEGGLILILGPAGLRLPLRHWDGDTFALAPRGENAPEGSLSSIRFEREGEAVTGFAVGYLDTHGLGRWTRAD